MRRSDEKYNKWCVVTEAKDKNASREKKSKRLQIQLKKEIETVGRLEPVAPELLKPEPGNCCLEDVRDVKVEIDNFLVYSALRSTC